MIMIHYHDDITKTLLIVIMIMIVAKDNDNDSIHNTDENNANYIDKHHKQK